MIYVSSSCIRTRSIDEAITELNNWGIDHIELSGGTDYSENIRQVLAKWKSKGLQLKVHNYFPPPEHPFIFNLGALDPDTHVMSMRHAISAIELNHFLGSDSIGFHAPFLLNIPIEFIGKKIPKFRLLDKERVVDRFISVFEVLESYAGLFGMRIYIENNVLSSPNYQNYFPEIPFLLITSEDYDTFREHIDFPILLDVAHLKVTCKSLGLDYKQQLEKLFPRTDYIHISDNDGKEDQNKPFLRDSELYAILSAFDWEGKSITLETYGDKKQIMESYETTMSLFD